jgi:hypothetical protein
MDLSNLKLLENRTMKKNTLLYLLFFLLFIGCSESEQDEINIIPNTDNLYTDNLSPDFSAVNVLNVSYNSATISWEPSTDPDNDLFYYNVYLEDELVIKGLNKDLIYKLEGLEEEMDYKGYLEITDSISIPVKSNFSFQTTKYFMVFDRLFQGEGGCQTVTKTIDGGYVFAGYAPYVGFSVTKIDMYGYEEWNNQFDLAPSQCLSIKKCYSEGYILSDEKKLIKLDASGNLEWEYNLGEEYSTDGLGFTSVVESQTDGFIAVGRCYDENGEHLLVSMIMKFSYNGKLVWKKTYGDHYRNGAFDIQETKKGEYIILGSKGNDNTKSVTVHRINSDGDILSAFNYSNEKYNFPKKILLTEDNGFIILGDSWDSRNVSSIRVFKIDETGEMQWESYFNWDATSTQGKDITISGKDDGFIIVGSNGYSPCSSLIVKIDQVGSLIWEKTYKPDYMDYLWGFSHIFPTKDSGYFLIGGKSWVWSGSGKESGLWLVKTDDELNFDY